MAIKDEIDRLLRERGEMTTGQLMEEIYQGDTRYNRAAKLSTVYAKCRNLEKWGRVERVGEDELGHMVWRAI